MHGVSTALRDSAKEKRSPFRRPGRRRSTARATAQIEPLDENAPSLVVATYNVHACIGTDRRYDPARVAAVLKPLPDQAAFLAEETGLQLVSGPNRSYRRSRFCNAILTRLPVRAVRYIDLSIPDCEPRGALDVDLDAGTQPLRVIATHFGLRGSERRAQTLRLLAALAGDRMEAGTAGAPTDGAVLMMGDLNEWRGRRGGIRALDRQLGHAPAPRTFPSWWPLLPLDRIYAAPPALVRDITVHRSPLARLASDHLPLRGRLAWRANGVRPAV